MKTSLLLISSLAILLTSSCYATQVKIPFHVPSGATTEMSRLYFDLIKEFEQSHPMIDIKLAPQNSYKNVLKQFVKKTKKKTSAGVAVVEISELVLLQDSHAIMPLDAFMEQEPGGKDSFLRPFIPNFLANSYGSDGQFYGLPLIRSTPIIYYNMDVLKEAGITLEQLPTTWEELTHTLQKITTMTGAPSLMLAPTWYDWLFESFVRQHGGALVNDTNTQVQFDHPEAIGALSYWQMLLKQGLMGRVVGSWKSTINGFALGKYPVIYYSTGGMGQLVENASFEWMVDVMPQKMVHATSIGAANIFLSNHMTAAEQAGAWAFVRFLIRPDIQARISHKSGYFPVVEAAFDEPLLKQRYAMEPFKRAKKQLGFAGPKMMPRHHAEIRNILKAAIDRTLNEGMSPEKSLRIAQQEVQKWLK